jgi:tRNA(Ile)-lysidine synthase
VHKTGDRLSIGRPEPRSGFQQPVSLSGVTRIRKLGLALDASIETAPKRDWSKRAGRSLQSFDMLDIKPPVIARSRRAGEKMVVFGGPERKVKDVLIDDGIPRQERDRLPVLSDRKGILWIAGSRRAERGRITPRTRRVLTLKVRNG